MSGDVNGEGDSDVEERRGEEDVLFTAGDEKAGDKKAEDKKENEPPVQLYGKDMIVAR